MPGFLLPQFQTEARTAAIRRQKALHRLDEAIEQHPLNPYVIVEVLQVPNRLGGAARMDVQRGGTV